MELKNLLLIFAISAVVNSCTDKQLSDAYGQFEADEITISAESSGTILKLNVEEGDVLTEGMKVGQIDTVQISLQKRELAATVHSIRSQIDQLNAQIKVLNEKLQTAEKELHRFSSLQASNAATQQQIDQSSGQVNVLRQQINSVEAQKKSVRAELDVMQVKHAKLNQQIKQASIINPVKGTVLLKLVETHEYIRVGQPVYTIANLKNMIFRGYVSGAQLSNIALGDTVNVYIDRDENSLDELDGTITWISDQAEFTPKMIQTREERVTQVYEVKIMVPNPNGRIKIGMPGEVRFNGSK